MAGRRRTIEMTAELGCFVFYWLPLASWPARPPLVGFSTPRDETTASGPQVSPSGHASSSSLSSIRKKKVQPLTVNACYAGLFLALLFGSSRFWLCFGKKFCSRYCIGRLTRCPKGFSDTNKKTNFIIRLETARQIF